MKVAALLSVVLLLLPAMGVAREPFAWQVGPEIAMRTRIPVRVVLVKDGDTVQVREFTHGIRIASIDAPESHHARGRPGQSFANVSRKGLVELLGNSRQVEAYCYELDRYQRAVCDVFADGRSVGRDLVANGLAWANESGGGRYLRDKQLLALQAQARARKAGLWAEAQPIEPWVWRDRCWKQEQCVPGAEP